MLSRFSKLGIASVAMILISGLPMALQYIDSLNGLIGTGYGNLLMVKITLLALALGFAWLNSGAVMNTAYPATAMPYTTVCPLLHRSRNLYSDRLAVYRRQPGFQPPAIDIPDLTASWQEVVNAFTPRIPRTQSPTHDALLAGEAGRVAIIGQTLSGNRLVRLQPQYRRHLSDGNEFLPCFPMSSSYPPQLRLTILS